MCVLCCREMSHMLIFLKGTTLTKMKPDHLCVNNPIALNTFIPGRLAENLSDDNDEDDNRLLYMRRQVVRRLPF